MKRETSQTVRRVMLTLALFLAIVPAFTTPARTARDLDQLLADMKQKRAALEAQLRVSSAPSTEALNHAVGGAINPGDYQCGPTLFASWTEEKFMPILLLYLSGYTDVRYAYDFAQEWSVVYALYYGEGSDQYVGPDGRETQKMTKRLKDCQRFWDSYSPGIQLRGWHGSVLADADKMVHLLTDFYGLELDDAVETVDYVQFWLQAFPELGFDNPLWTWGFYSLRGIPDGLPELDSPVILLGDGFLQELSDLGFDADGADIYFAHEFAHQVQYELGIWEENSPETTRHTELMADAFAAYYCAHSRGASYQAKRILDVLRADYQGGDCAFDDIGHHGTPNQRQAAAKWGTALAEAAQKQGLIKPSGLMYLLFEEAYPSLIAPDNN